MNTEHREPDFRAGERRTATILFTDMKDFTRLSEDMDPEEMDNLMSTVFSEFEAIIQSHDGTVEKYIGDALVAVFGARTIHEDDPDRAVNAALDFVSKIEELNGSLRSRGLKLSFRSGVHTGLITTGKRGQFEVVTGHAMSVASRLQNLAEPDTILVSEATRESCENEFLFSEPLDLQLRGKEETLVAFVVKGRNLHPTRESSLFVGRDELLSDMVKAYLKHEPTTTDGFFLVGDAGIGKTALAFRFIDGIRRFPGFSSPVLYARAQRYRNIPFAVITDMVSNYLGLENRADEAAVLSRLESALSVETTSAREFAALVCGRHSGSLDTQSFVHLYMIVTGILRARADSPYPSVMFIDNTTYMDEQSRDFLQFFLRNSTDRPLFLLADRTTQSSLTELFMGVRTLTVPQLSNDESVALVKGLWRDGRDDAVLGTILGNAGGNPLFIREYVRYARETKDLSSLPATIQTIFLSSIDNLEPSYRDLLQKLSVFAHSFSVEDAVYIQEHTDGDPAIVVPAIELFQKQGIIICESTYMFKHDLFKKAVYDSLLNYNKRVVHRLIANRMREAGNPHTVRLMHHLTRAEDYADARSVLLGAIDHTVNMEYLRFLDLLLEKCDATDYDSRIQYLFAKSAVLFNNGNTENADEILKQILRLAVQQKSPIYMANAYHLLAAYNMKSYAFQKAYFCGRKALSYYEQTGNRQNAEANVIKTMSLTELLRNNLEESARLIARLSDERFSHVLDVVEARAERFLLTGDYREAVELLEYGMQRIGENADDHWFSVHSLAAITYWQLCDFQRMKEVITRLLGAGGQHYSNISQLHAHLSVACRFTDEEPRVEEHLKQAEFYAYQIHNDFDLIDALRSLAVSLLILGKVEKAAEIAREGITIGLRHSAFYPTFTLMMVLSEILYLHGELESCRFFIDEATFSVELDPLLPPRDLLIYYYLRYLLDPGQKRSDYLETACGLLEHEKAEIEQPALIANFLKLRLFGKIQKESDRLGFSRDSRASEAKSSGR
ncbi:MAG TPA: adenylate/guanylate cyclase domain-containing protein [Spirochaetia bacterium]|nr:adenylate/guanylate cyclase domain-containing protein [Spirochaetia bacterium]